MADAADRRGAGLRPRLILMLTLALLPLGAIAYWQSARVISAAERQEDLLLLARTERAANPLQSTIQGALGAAGAIGVLFDRLQADPDGCAVYLGRILEERPDYSFVGLLPRDGRMTCSTAGRPFDFSTFDSFGESVEDPRINITSNPDAPLSGQAVLIVTRPVREGADLKGFVSISVPVDSVAATVAGGLGAAERTIELITLNAAGRVLTSTVPGADVELHLPPEDGLADLLAQPGRVRVVADATGERRAYAVATLVPDVAYAVGSWPVASQSPPWLSALRSLGMPLAMWATSLVVAILAVEMMVGRPIRTLSDQMRRFARSRRLSDSPELAGAPAELVRIEDDFRDMAGSILRDEATLEDNLREKNVLLKEVHHRVKNNLQLISSVVNMEGRRVADAAARAPLGRLQDRIMGLALVHRALYQSDDLHRIDLRRLLRELAQQAGQGGAALGPAPAVEGPDGIALDPDRAVPLSLLVSEALTNAQRHGAGGARIHVSVEAGEVRLRIENPVAAEGAGGADAEPGGARLGSQLIRAFAQQVGGRLETGADGSGTYAVELRFPEEASKPPAKDY